MTFSQCKKYLAMLLTNNTKYIAKLKRNSTSLLRYNVETGAKEEFQIQGKETVAFGYSIASYIFLNTCHLFFCGDVNEKDKVIPDTYVFDFFNAKLHRKQDMNYPRCLHALTRLNEFVYAFGGESLPGMDKTCEKYNTKTDEWSEIASLPINGNYAYATTHNNAIFLTAQSWDTILQYSPLTNEYTQVGEPVSSNIGKVLVSCKCELILITGNSVKSVDKQQELFAHRQSFPWINTYGVQNGNRVYWSDRYNSIVTYDIGRQTVSRIPLR